MSDVKATLNAQAVRFEEKLQHFLPNGNSVIAQAMCYSLDGGGKRIRPVLAMAFCNVFGGDDASVIPYAVAIEMIHCYSLVHDDLPCMDNDDMRRGLPSCHKKFGENAALLAGDALLTEAFAVAAQGGDMAAIAILARAAGEQGMIGGQWLDLSHENKTITLAQLEEMNRGKTCALLRAACELGCLAAGASEEQTQAAQEYADALGLLFQLTDDILDVTSTAGQLGKSIGKDAAAGKNTWVSLLGLQQAKVHAKTLAGQAQQTIMPFVAQDDLLYHLPGWLLEREF